ncbi:hypothetical protein CAY60_020715 [Shouchella clausii]|uniref:hypothetical protein n=1 Tax=Shouchella TaxID=2893057 RepID=UPI0004E69560|nr:MULTISPECIES: hypothetical protein [Shouchella]NKR09442.1 hypothetical protein [Escherichia coli]ALA55233.1 hypothetical protein DB29_0P0021 [Shouchella clausii]MBU3266275.1 hypothetical protein [Shouchella clausii]MBU3509368.1 hypothetical protein [Shouchella clausii]MDP0462089.1 hypothetical protein [Shouchella rhizosphaerae]
MNLKEKIATCPYCGTEVVEQQADYYCSFCEMSIPSLSIQYNHNRPEVFTDFDLCEDEFLLDLYINKNTQEFLQLSTYELLYVLRHIRAQRSEIYKSLHTFRNAQGTDEYTDEAGKLYEESTKRMFVVENILRQRLGYVPPRVTEHFLSKYKEMILRDKGNAMVIRKKSVFDQQMGYNNK